MLLQWPFFLEAQLVRGIKSEMACEQVLLGFSGMWVSERSHSWLRLGAE